MTSNEELRKAMCLTAVLAEVVGADCAAECAASVVGTIRLLEEEIGHGDTREVMREVFSHRRKKWLAYGIGWNMLTDDRGAEKLAVRAAQAWDTGMVPV